MPEAGGITSGLPVIREESKTQDKMPERYPDRVNPGERSGFRRARSNRKLFRTEGVYLCGSCNS